MPFQGLISFCSASPNRLALLSECILFAHSLAEGPLACTWVSTCKSACCEQLCAGLCVHKCFQYLCVMEYALFCERAKLYSKVTAPFSISKSLMISPVPLACRQELVLSVFHTSIPLTNHLTILLIYILLIMDDTECRCLWLFVICTIPLVKCQPEWSHFQIRSLTFFWLKF